MYKENKNEPLSEEEIIEGAYGRDDTSYLSKDEVTTLVKRAKEGDIKARNRCVSSLTGLAYFIADKFYSRSEITDFNRMTRDDLAQEGLKKLLEKFDCYDPSESRLSTFFSRVMLREMQKAYVDNTLFGPSEAALFKYKKEEAEGKRKKRIEQVHLFSSRHSPTVENEESLFESSIPESDSYQSRGQKDPIGPDKATEESEELNRLYDAIEDLDYKDKKLLYDRFYEGRSLRSIGEEMGVSRQWVSVLQNEAVEKLRGQMTSKEPTKKTSSLEKALEKYGLTGIDEEVEEEIEERLRLGRYDEAA